MIAINAAEYQRDYQIKLTLYERATGNRIAWLEKQN
jgi:hypothetical protein